MRLYQFTLPCHTNAGLSYAQARKDWEAYALTYAGGFTRPQAFSDGVWKNTEGNTYKDVVIPYHVACDRIEFVTLLAHAFHLFPDQEAIFTADLGEATIHPRTEARI